MTTPDNRPECSGDPAREGRSPDSSPPVRVDYRKFMAWVGLNGPRPSNTELAFYLEIELGNREDVDAVEAAVLLEAIEVLKAAPPKPAPDAMREALKVARCFVKYMTLGSIQERSVVVRQIDAVLSRTRAVTRWGGRALPYSVEAAMSEPHSKLLTARREAIAEIFYEVMPYVEDDVKHLGKPTWDSDRDTPQKAEAREYADRVLKLTKSK